MKNKSDYLLKPAALFSVPPFHWSLLAYKLRFYNNDFI